MGLLTIEIEDIETYELTVISRENIPAGSYDIDIRDKYGEYIPENYGIYKVSVGGEYIDGYVDGDIVTVDLKGNRRITLKIGIQYELQEGIGSLSTKINYIDTGVVRELAKERLPIGEYDIDILEKYGDHIPENHIVHEILVGDQIIEGYTEGDTITLEIEDRNLTNLYIRIEEGKEEEPEEEELE